MQLAFTLWGKIGLTALVAIGGGLLGVMTALFGPGAMPETGEGSSSWITVAIVSCIIIAAIWIFA